jgi:hypothetical protein
LSDTFRVLSDTAGILIATGREPPGHESTGGSMSTALEQTDEEARAEAEAALEAERLAQQDAEADARAAAAAEQAALDEEDRQTPDLPEGAADDEEPPELDGSTAAEADRQPAGDELAASLRNASGIAGDEAEARGELPGMPPKKLTSHAGGQAPNLSEFKLNGRSLDLGAGTQFDKGSRSTILIEVEWTGVNFVDKHDKETGQVTDTIRRHAGKIIGYGLEDVAD